MSVTTTAPRDLQPLPGLSSLLRRLFGPRPRHEAPAAEDSFARREFILEMLDRNSSAFASDADLRGLMHLYPDRF